MCRWALAVLAMALLCWSCVDEETAAPAAQQPDGQYLFTIAADEQPWQGQTVDITRVGETLLALKTNGFGLFSDNLGLTNQEVSWKENAWDYGSKLLWPNNVVKYSVSFNGEMKESKAEYFTKTGDSFNSKFNGCTYQGIDFTSGFELESGAKITWTSGAKGNKTKVIIVQSNWEKTDGEEVYGTPNTIQFDDVELKLDGSASLESGATYSVKKIKGGLIYTIRNVAPGSHSIMRYNKESGIFYVSVDVDVYAYAPYNSGTTLTGDKITFSPGTDLLWAEDSVSTDGMIHLNFKHALGKLSFGHITNNYGRDITLEKVSLSYTPRYTSGGLSLVNGTWTETSSESLSDTYSLSPNLSVGEGKSENLGLESVLQIPGSTVTATFTFTSADYGTESITSPAIEFEQGVNKTVSVTIGMNHEVVIK